MSWNKNDNNIIADVGSTAINDGVSIYDTQQALNISNKDLGELCNSEKINPWAKYKPVIYLDDLTGNPILNTLGQGTQDASTGNWTWKPDSTWWKGHMLATQLSYHIYTCGWYIPIVSTDDLVDAYRDGDQDDYMWQYMQPGEGSGFRQTDFLGYKPTAVPPFTKFISSKPIYSKTEQIEFSINNNVSSNDGKSLVLTDFSDLKEYYFGVAVWEEGSTSRSHTITSSTEIKNMGSDPISVKGPAIASEGKYCAIPFLCQNPSTTWGQNSLSVIPLDNMGIATFEVAEDAIEWIKITDFSFGTRSQPSLSSEFDWLDVKIVYTTRRGTGQGNYDNSSKVAVYETVITTSEYTGSMRLDAASLDNGNGVNSYELTYGKTLQGNPSVTVDVCSLGQTSSSTPGLDDNNCIKFSCKVGHDWDKFNIRVACRVYKSSEDWDNTGGNVYSQDSSKTAFGVTAQFSTADQSSGPGGIILINNGESTGGGHGYTLPALEDGH